MNLGSTPTKAQVHLHNLLSSNIRYFRQSTEDGCMIKKWHAEHGQELQPKHNLFRYGRSILVSPIWPKQSRFFFDLPQSPEFPHVLFRTTPWLFKRSCQDKFWCFFWTKTGQNKHIFSKKCYQNIFCTLLVLTNIEFHKHEMLIYRLKIVEVTKMISIG